MKFFDWLEENYGIDRYEWDENYSYSDGQGKEIWEDYEYCMEKLEQGVLNND